MKFNTSLISTGMLTLTLFCFFLPFLDISCNNTRIARLTGKDLITGTKIEAPNEMNDFLNDSEEGGMDKTTIKEEFDGEKIKPNGWVISGFLSAMFGLVLGIFIRRRKEWIHSFFALAGIVSLIAFQIQANARFNDKSGVELFKVEMHADYLVGYWLALILFGLVCGISLFGVFFLRKVLR